ncbi:CoA protein activase [Paramaledivibacter caminithermalis]|jgi:predicted nucleotide-binding protein (sugar kinase/HSP70/actin superfamily)|uniref:Predicted nucleotide-binding protein, sugar kinase/HSP70/actin superfamily n=1 Tax=Paramaledivibacter caminithermalis (strain DSM 15212 / CIP 107654 / DViRD3) TaxID=1121301 RepID=A0A1M6SI96_PARC5|nr:CoA protein activase [Paramaledivibacter caminithermalis]SHK44504.1 Predicted nucleotide-binding protein, sugar kinase/HSP70/actin superfamily [Paramaledivibacter caminithermalis DSM 15212]
MKITFPHIGNSYIPIKALFDDLGVETIVPPKCSKKTLELGTKYAPELICLPLKINLGNYLESIEKGADTIVITGGCGPCRFGYYSEVQKEILKDLGYDVDIVVLEAPEGDRGEFLRRVSKIANTRNIIKIGRSLKNSITVLKKLNRFEEMVLKKRPYEINENQIDNLYDRLIKNLEASRGSKEMTEHLNKALKIIEEVPLDKNRDVLKIGLVGEIYTVIEDFSNLDIGKKLNKMGVEVHKSLSTGEWISEMLIYRSLGLSKEVKIWEAAKPYIKTCIGGHARETVGNTVLYSKKGYDGVIQLMPFTCMPEIVSMSLMPSIQAENDIPILSLIIDEMTGEGGYLTRLEAFVDLLRNRKEKGQYAEKLS